MSFDPAPLGTRLEAILGRARLAREVDKTEPYAVDGVLPAFVAIPDNQEELAQVVRACHEAGAAMIPWGGGTAMGLGNPPLRADVVILMDRLNRVVEYDPANLVITAEAGLRLSALQERIDHDKEVLPLDPPGMAKATVGGLVAANQLGPGRLLYGGLRDWVLGMRVILPDGTPVHFGGRVIKNVSGYDMNKLFIRSLGTLGIITEVTFKLLPRPAARAGVIGLFPGAAQAWAVVRRTLESYLLPEALDYLNPAAMARLAPALALPPQGGGFGVAVAVAGSPETVDRQLRDFSAIFREGGGMAIPLGDGREAWNAIRNLAVLPAGEQGLLCRIAVPVSEGAQMASAAEACSAECGMEVLVEAHAGVGVLWALFRPAGEAPSEEKVNMALSALRRSAESLGGSLVLQEAPASLKRRLDAWGSAGEGIGMMRRIKTEFDPLGLCSPGRFVGGI